MFDKSLAETTLGGLRVRAWRLHIDTPGVFANVPMLRGVWGAAMRTESEAIYQDLFEGGEQGVPRYLMRPAPPGAMPSPAVEFLLFGTSTVESDAVVWAAWDRACHQGLGPAR